MALTVPSIQQLETFKNDKFDLSEYAAVTMHLQAATDLMEVATGIHEDFPNTTIEYRMMQRGILDLAWYIGTSMEDRDAQFSPFSSERIGSYSYSKSSRAIALGGDTGVPFFDMAVALLAGSETSGILGSIGASSTYVMPGESWYHDRGPYGLGFGAD